MSHFRLLSNITASVLLVGIMMSGCSPQLSDQQTLEHLIGIEICDSVEVTTIQTSGTESIFVFDEVYVFELVGELDCLESMISNIRKTQSCADYSVQLACDSDDGDTLIIDQTRQGLTFTYST